MLGVPIGSYLATFGWPVPFIAIGICAFLMVILIATFLLSIPAVISQGKVPSISDRYRTLLNGNRSKIAFLAYFLFQLGNYATFSFMGTWFADKFGLSVASIGTVILFLGLGNTLSSFFSSGLVQKIGLNFLHFRNDPTCFTLFSPPVFAKYYICNGVLLFDLFLIWNGFSTHDELIAEAIFYSTRNDFLTSKLIHVFRSNCWIVCSWNPLREYEWFYFG
ncbi:Major Facilitator Superfamily protein [Seinonella peptonophila]|uniref:Major Facilitator Superfamily protein n=1 Tax=Seinonella peptonophila TaxID=112248 RepID=A0A1M5B482_9BACL|nr:Major Facilitator Superfamily protein [Seinonella peptonophila]